MKKTTKKKDFTHVTSKKYDGMMGRCYRPSDTSYKNYGAKGIRVAGEWIKELNSFRLWIMGELDRIGISVEDFVKNSKNIHLDRIDPKGHYTPRNCRLVSAQTNSRNKTIKANRTIVSAEGEIIHMAEPQEKEVELKLMKGI